MLSFSPKREHFCGSREGITSTLSYMHETMTASKRNLTSKVSTPFSYRKGMRVRPSGTHRGGLAVLYIFGPKDLQGWGTYVEKKNA